MNLSAINMHTDIGVEVHDDQQDAKHGADWADHVPRRFHDDQEMFYLGKKSRQFKNADENDDLKAHDEPIHVSDTVVRGRDKVPVT